MCPIKRKKDSIEAWLSEVELWDKSNNTGDPAKHNLKKYIPLMKCKRNTEDKKLKRTAQI